MSYDSSNQKIYWRLSGHDPTSGNHSREGRAWDIVSLGNTCAVKIAASEVMIVMAGGTAMPRRRGKKLSLTMTSFAHRLLVRSRAEDPECC